MILTALLRLKDGGYYALHATGLSASHPGSQSMQDYVCENISGAVMANEKLSVVLKREKNSEGGSNVNGRE